MLHQIQAAVNERTSEILAAHPGWPCRKGCDDCCRRLAAVPLVSETEWRRIAAALDVLPTPTAESARHRIAASASLSRPVVCPLLDLAAGACLIYDARPIACRTYGFYADRECVLGCHRIESIAKQSPDIIWGNHRAVEARLESLGPVKPLNGWL